MLLQEDEEGVPEVVTASLDDVITTSEDRTEIR
jgi:hypothetical protein